MSSALAIASVTAVLRELLHDALVDHDVSAIVADAEVTAVAPDRVPLENGETGRLNLYLYGVTPNAGWRNVGLPSRNGLGERLTNAPLALDLHYLLTAYGAEDFHAEVLLGYAMQRLHEVPVLERATVRAILGQATILDGRLAEAGLGDQVEQIKLVPEAMGTEEISKLWTAFQASYRPSAAYRASVVLIEAEEPVRTALPVLTRGPRDAVTGAERGPVAVAGLVPPYPALTGIAPPDAQVVARLGDAVRLLGHHLDGADHAIVFTHARLDATREVAPDAVAAGEVAVTIPDDAPEDWPSGLYAVHVALTREGTARTTNALPLGLAPTIDVAGITVDTDGSTTTLEVPVAPEVWPGQRASLVVGQREVAAGEHAAPSDMLTFTLEDAAPGTHFVRLRVDGVESVLVDRSVTPPAFDLSQQVTIP
jgi:hypothetical protein